MIYEYRAGGQPFAMVHMGELTPVTTENSTHDYLARLVARMLAAGWVPQFEERECGDGVQVWTVTWRRMGE